MIHVLLTRRHAYTVSTYLESAGAALADRIRALPYEEVFRRPTLSRGTYVLTDFDRLPEARLRHVDLLADALDAEGVRRLNRPDRWLSRRVLLERLHAEGVNPFRAFRLDDLPADLRYPVFLRLENDHQGDRGGLLESRAQIDAAANTLRKRGKRRRDMIVVEFSDTVDDQGRYRKYAAFCIDGTVIPRHAFFGPTWMVKHPVLHGESELEAEWTYVEANPHADQIGKVFELAGVDYGRVDYAVVDDRIRVWEINTNPMIATADDVSDGRRAQTAGLFASRIAAAWDSIDTATDGELVVLPPMRLALGERLEIVRDRLARQLRLP